MGTHSGAACPGREGKSPDCPCAPPIPGPGLPGSLSAQTLSWAPQRRLQPSARPPRVRPAMQMPPVSLRPFPRPSPLPETPRGGVGDGTSAWGPRSAHRIQRVPWHPPPQASHHKARGLGHGGEAVPNPPSHFRKAGRKPDVPAQRPCSGRGCVALPLPRARILLSGSVGSVCPPTPASRTAARRHSEQPSRHRAEPLLLNRKHPPGSPAGVRGAVGGRGVAWHSCAHTHGGHRPGGEPCLAPLRAGGWGAPWGLG